jgi:hypothetical protein
MATEPPDRDPADDKPEERRGGEHDPVEEAREIVDYTVDKVRDLRAFVRSIHSRYLIALLSLYGLTAAGGTLIVAMNPFRDWYMFLAMYLVIFAFLLLYVKAHYRGRPVVKAITLLFTLALIGFWCGMLHDRIPAQRVWFGTEVIARDALPILWAPIGGLLGVALLLVAHWAVIGRH